MILAALAALATAGEPELADGFSLWRSGRAAEAAAVATAHLAVDPWDVEAHALYITAWTGEAGEDEDIRAMYAALLAGALDEPAAHAAYALALTQTQRSRGPWCEEVERQVTELAAARPEVKLWGLQALVQARKLCPGSRDEALLALDDLGQSWPAAAHVATTFRLADRQRVTGALARAAELAWRERPWTLDTGRWLWRDEIRGPGRGYARRAALALAAEAQASDHAATVDAARRIARAAGESTLERAITNQLLALDPGWTDAVDEERVRVGIMVASMMPGRIGLDALLRLARDEPATGAGTAAVLSATAERLEAVERVPEALTMRRAAIDAQSDAARWRVEWAWSVARFGGEDQDVADALEVAERAVSSADSPEQAAALALRGRLRLLSGDALGALFDLHEARLLGDDPALHLWVGLGAEAAGEAASTPAQKVERQIWAMRELSLGLLQVAESGPDAPLREARAALRRVYGALPYGLPGGVDAYLDAAGEVNQAARPRVPPVGERMPALAWLDLDGEPHNTAQVEGPFVVDLWATWCAPCRASLPHLQEVAAAYESAGVTVLALSVDDHEREARRFASQQQGAAVFGWSGEEAMLATGTRAIPATFVVGADGLIAAVVRGWRGDGDRRLEDALDQVLGVSKEAPVAPEAPTGVQFP